MPGAGTINLVDGYAEAAVAEAFVFMDTPDTIASLRRVELPVVPICFATGRGSAFDCKPASSIKLATNTPIWDRMREQ
jgi:altronate dehydratase